MSFLGKGVEGLSGSVIGLKIRSKERAPALTHKDGFASKCLLLGCYQQYERRENL